MIKMVNIQKSYSMDNTRVHALNNISLEIGTGEFVSVQGTSGSGKSTLLNILGILDTADSGQYYLQGRPTTKLSQVEAAHYRSQYIGFIFQSFNLIQHKNAIENIALPLMYQGVSRKVRNTIALEYLDMVGLRDRANHKPSELSGGQSQRVAIARALVTNPALILADEPTGALDTATTEQIMNAFRVINNQGTAVLIVTHEPEIANQTRRKILMRDGQIISDQSNLISEFVSASQ